MENNNNYNYSEAQGQNVPNGQNIQNAPNGQSGYENQSYYSRIRNESQYNYVPQNTTAQTNAAYPQPAYTTAPIYIQSPAEGAGTKALSTVTPNNGRKKLIAGIALGVAASLLIGMFGAIIGRSTAKSSDIAANGHDAVNILVAETPVNEIVIPEDNATLLTYSQIAAKVSSGVAGITLYTDAYGWGQMVYAQGSGFIISDSGYIVTNSHVVDDTNYSKYKITATIAQKNGENTEVEVSVAGVDTKTDLAVLKFDPSGIDFTVCELGKSSSLILGEEVVAIGNPGGSQFANSITNGIISGLNRVIDESSGASDTAIKYIQTNAAINPGNSGGPLLNMYGQVIGINTSKIVAEGYEGLGFAIPIEDAKPIIEELIEKGQISRPALGLKLAEVTEQSAAWYDIPQGLMIRGMATNSSCVGKGIQEYDIITRINGTEIKTFNDLDSVMQDCKVGDTVTLTIFRRGSDQTFDVEIELISDVEANYEVSNNGRP